ncbi:alpha/beta fold hydrolase [Streptomyces sp. NPDC003027]
MGEPRCGDRRGAPRIGPASSCGAARSTARTAPSASTGRIAATDAQLNDPDPPWREGPAAVTAPTLVLGGGRESHLPQEQQAWTADRIPDARHVTIEAGHLIHASRPAEFLDVLREFGV